MPPTPNPNRRPRPINPFDNPSTTGLLVNPNGTYIANPYPTTAAIGGTGAFGSMLPQVNVQGQTWMQQAANMANPATAPNNLGGVGNVPYGPQYPPQEFFVRPMSRLGGYYGPNYRAQPSLEAPATNYAGSSVMDNYGYQQTSGIVATNVIDQIIREGVNSGTYDMLSPAQKETIDRIVEKQTAAGQGGAGGTLGEGDFYGYERDPETGRSVRVVKNAANGDNFLKELRWDPQRKKYVQIGKLLKEGKLDLKGNWNRRGNRKGGGGGVGGGNRRRQQAPPGVQETTGGFTGSYGVVNFNTGTG
jgi:hypothetical protein